MATANEFDIFDRINLIDMCNKIIAFSNLHKDNAELGEFNSRPAIISRVLPCKNEQALWENEVKILGKIFSGERPPKSLKQIPKYIGEPSFRSEIMGRCYNLERTIRDVVSEEYDGLEFLESLFDSCSSLYFSEDEIRQLSDRLHAEKVDRNENFIGILFFHAFANIAINLPDYTVDRIFKEALTITPSKAMYSKLLKRAADNGHGYAALLYANHVYSDCETALKYFLIASGYWNEDGKTSIGRPSAQETESNALWEIAYMFENHYVSENHIKYVDSFLEIEERIKKADNDRRSLNIGIISNKNSIVELKDKILGYPFDEGEVKQITQYTKDECVIYALKIYLYIAKKDLTFPKAFNSLGKLILGDYIGKASKTPKKDIDALRFELAKKYLDTAIQFGNTNAMVNIAVYYHNQLKLGKKLTESQTRDMKYYFDVAAEFDEREAQLHLGELLMEDGDYKKAEKLLNYAANNGDANACHNLGKIHSFNFYDKEAIEYFEKAIAQGCHDAAYDLAELYLLRLSAKSGEPLATTYRQYAIHLIKERIAYMSEEYKEKSLNLLSDIGVDI